MGAGYGLAAAPAAVAAAPIAAAPVAYAAHPAAYINPYDYAGQVYPAAEPYIHAEVAAEPYVHAEIAAEPYVHVEPAAVPSVHQVAAPVAIAAAPAYAYGGYGLGAFGGYHGAYGYAGLPAVAYNGAYAIPAVTKA